ncbi:PEP-CTERM system histidine kinase PrsK, partial [Escherichia marmotae]|nr:PEP-CTERM system histidine kinase PrsK [Escherichia marmotae]
RPLAFALAATALWALAIAGIGSTDIASWFAETLRNLAWLGFMLMLHRRDAQARPPIALGTVYGVVALVQIGTLALTLIAYTDPEPI